MHMARDIAVTHMTASMMKLHAAILGHISLLSANTIALSAHYASYGICRSCFKGHM